MSYNTLFTDRTQWYVGTLPVERKYDLHQSLAHCRDHVGPERVDEDLLLGESQQEEEQAIVRAECGHQQLEVCSRPTKRELVAVLTSDDCYLGSGSSWGW